MRAMSFQVSALLYKHAALQKSTVEFANIISSFP